MASDTKKELRNLMMYQIFVRNYSKEGTFRAVENDIPRIKSLGTDIVYLMPIHPLGEKNRKVSSGIRSEGKRHHDDDGYESADCVNQYIEERFC